jgi:hypothetical protein
MFPDGSSACATLRSGRRPRSWAWMPSPGAMARPGLEPVRTASPGHGHGRLHRRLMARPGLEPVPSPPAYGETRTRTGDTTIFSCATRASEFARFAGKSVASGAVSWFRAFPDFAVVSRRLRQTAAPVCLFAGPAHSCSQCGRLKALAEPRGHGPPGPVVAGGGATAPGLVDAVAGAYEAAPVGEHDELSAVADGELHHRSVDMRLDRER